MRNALHMLRRLAPVVLCIFFAISPSNSARGTTIVVARTRNEIVIGADSKVTDAYGDVVSRSACKILQVGNLVIAMEGLEIDRQTNFSVPAIVTTVLQMNPLVASTEKVSTLTGVLVTRLFDELPQIKKSAPETYRKKIEGGQTFLRIVIAGFEKGRPLVFVRSFRGAQIASQQFGVTVVPDDCLDDCRGEVVTRFLGETDAIEDMPEETPGFWQSGLTEGVRRLVQTEIVARSEYVGPPIDIVRISKGGVQWIQRKPECSEVNNREKRPNRPGKGHE